ncbi:FlgB family protein [Pelagovum pacificum]|uniref:FlgB family protein n=1 Tax=Pelagovum pacificum TaxID=2588711 RepID=A0A5C5GH18_9RHOB|nr:FlgB family protein [Pelagovum pacificum]QQA42984.1 FlgB family protein [Pelagovum pacificum]TNY33870.1 FlgB family protein [Pelagovum pacificum]
MYENLTVMRTSAAMAEHAAQRQTLTAQNIANADTPGYIARQLPPFRDFAEGGLAPRASRSGHQAMKAPEATPTRAEPAPNGNAVSIEVEMVNAVEIQREHVQALAIYKHAMDVLRLSIGRK